MKPVSIFISYSHKDENFRKELAAHLRVLERLGIVTSWHDRRILPGSDWSREIDHHIDQASIVLCLVSADFFDSDYCWEKEMRRALVRHSAKQAVVIPILIRPVAWDRTPLPPSRACPLGWCQSRIPPVPILRGGLSSKASWKLLRASSGRGNAS